MDNFGLPPLLSLRNEEDSQEFQDSFQLIRSCLCIAEHHPRDVLSSQAVRNWDPLRSPSTLSINPRVCWRILLFWRAHTSSWAALTQAPEWSLAGLGKIRPRKWQGHRGPVNWQGHVTPKDKDSERRYFTNTPQLCEEK